MLTKSIWQNGIHHFESSVCLVNKKYWKALTDKLDKYETICNATLSRTDKDFMSIKKQNVSI